MTFNPEPIDDGAAVDPDAADYPAVDIDWNWRPMPIDPSLLSPVDNLER